MTYHPPKKCRKTGCRSITESIYAKRWILRKGKWTTAIIGYRCIKNLHTLYLPPDPELSIKRPKPTKWKPSK